MATNGKRAARKAQPRRRSVGIKPTAEPDTSGIVLRTRTRLNFSQERFAKYIGVSKRTIIRWENGSPFPNWARVRIKEIMNATQWSKSK